jgi:hypothetical protein
MKVENKLNGIWKERKKIKCSNVKGETNEGG